MRPVARRAKLNGLASRQEVNSPSTAAAPSKPLDEANPQGPNPLDDAAEYARREADFATPADPSPTLTEVSVDELAYPAVSDFQPDMYFRVDLDIFRGPLDLLLYLVRKHELDVMEIPLSLITDQFLDHMHILEELDVNAVGDFIEIASLLLEIKARSILPQQDEADAEEPLEEAHNELVQRLLEYKRYKDAACMLEERGRQWQQRYSRLPNDLPPRNVDPAEQPIHEVELWDLVSAMGRIVKQAERVANVSSIQYDETPIQVYMQQIHERLASEHRVAFTSMFQANMRKSQIIGIFLALLELIRHHSVSAEQPDLHGEICLVQGDSFEQVLDLSKVDDYSHKRAEEAEPA